MGETRFTLMAYAAEGWPTVKSVESRDAEQVLKEAQAMLDLHAACERVEVWSGGQCVSTLRKSAPA